MSKQEKSGVGKSIASAIVVGMVILTIKGWNHTPWVKESRKIKSVKVELAAYDFRTGVLAVRLQNNSMYDMKDVELKCSLYGASGTKLETYKITIYEKLGGGETIESGESVDASSIQVAQTECEVVDAEVFDTVYGGQKYEPGDPLPSRPATN